LLEDYVAGVISSEIGCQAPIEALKAQAVCARTYLLKSDSKKYKKFKATVDDSTDFQVYNKTQPNKKCYKAAKDTKGIVLKYNNCLINAYYFSTSCGYTTDYRIWGTKKKKYLQSVNLNNGEYKNIKTEDGFKNYILNNSDGIEREYPYYRWNVTLSDLQIQNAIYGLTKVNIGKIQSINVIKRGEGGIAAQIVVKGDMKQIIIRNQNEIRNAFCSVYANIKLNNGETVSGMTMLPSAFIYIEKVKAGYKIYGGGYGHGSGMSQNAAIVMAKNGVKYDEILKKFYINAELKSY
jgi:stage II sporulation protein D